KLEENNYQNIKLNIITDFKKISPKLKNEISNFKNLSLNDFSFNSKELNDIYAESDILLNPTRQDSFPLVILEAMKKGNIVISTDLYAIPEIVKDEKNSLLTQPRYRFFEYNNLPNEYVWNNRNKTIYSNYIDKNIINFMYEKIIFLYNNPNK